MRSMFAVFVAMTTLGMFVMADGILHGGIALRSAAVGPDVTVPLWALLVMGAGSFAGAVALAFARGHAKRVRADDDPSNDWQADIIEAIDEAASKGDMAQVQKLAGTLLAAKGRR